MSRTAKCLFIALVMSVMIMVLALVYQTTSASDADETASSIRKTVVANLEATQSKDIEAIIKTVHSQTPFYLDGLQAIVSLFKEYDFECKYELLSYKYIGQDGEYAIARLKFSTKKVSGSSAFRDNTLDTIVAFRQEKGQWRFWNQLVLELKYDNE